MYSVSPEYLAAIQSNSRNFYYEGEIITKGGTKYYFRNEDIVKGSGYIRNQCCDDTEISIGAVYAAELGVSLYSSIDRYTLKDGEIRLDFFLRLAGGSYEKVPLGVFDISEATRTAKCISIKAYDHMLRFEKSFSGKVSSGTASQFLALACKECGVELAHTTEEIDKWENGSTILGIYSENDIETWRDVLYYVAQVLGRFCTINRLGQLELRKFGTDVAVTIPATQRYSTSFSDFVTRFTAVSSTNSRTQTAEYYALDPDDGLTMNLGVNPLLQFGLDETRNQLIQNILQDIRPICYVPFTSDTIGDPAFDLGDVIRFAGGHADDTQITCITKYEYKINGKHTIKCVGKDPRLAAAKSKNDKNIAGLLNQIEAGKIAVYTFINASAYTLKENEVEICSIEFASTEETDAEFHASILLDIRADPILRSVSSSIAVGEETKSVDLSWQEDGQAKVYVTYLLNDELLTNYCPVETLHSGEHILTLYYPLSGLSGNSLNIFRVRLRIAGGSGTVAPMQEICTISGQGLSANSAWDGRLEFTDEYRPLAMSESLALLPLSAIPEVNQQIPVPYGFSERFVGVAMRDTMQLAAFSDRESINEVVTKQSVYFSGNPYTRTADGKIYIRKNFSYTACEMPFDEGCMEQLVLPTTDKTTVTGIEVKVDGEL